MILKLQVIKKIHVLFFVLLSSGQAWADSSANLSNQYYLLDKFDLATIHRSNECNDICFHVSKGETEFKLFKLDTRIKSNTVISVHVENTSDISSTFPLIKIASIGSLSGVNESDGSEFGPYQDVVNVLDENANHQFDTSDVFMVDVKIHENTDPGLYRASVVLNFENDKKLKIPVLIVVLDADINFRNVVSTHMFGLDVSSIKYWYGLTEVDEELQELIRKYRSTLSDFLINPAKFPPPIYLNKNRLPKVNDNEESEFRYLKFNPGDFIELTAPRFDQIQEKIMLSAIIRSDNQDIGQFLTYRWLSRNAGISLSIEDGYLIFRYGVEAELGYQLKNVEIPFKLTGDWQKILVHKEGPNLKLMNGAGEVVNYEIDAAIADAPGSVLIIKSKNSEFDIQFLNWTINSKEDSNVLSLDKPFKFIDRLSQEKLIATIDRALVELSLSRPAVINDVSSVLQDGFLEDSEFKAKVDHLARAGGYFKMPHDEGVSGASVMKNINYSQNSKRLYPTMRILHSVGSLGGRNLSLKRKRQALYQIINHVDILSIRTKYLDIFRKLLAGSSTGSGLEVSPYIHELDKVQNPNRLGIARAFFWKLFANGYNSISYWNVNLWFQPAKSGRQTRWIESKDDGFQVSLRNPSGIASGLLLYPGYKGPLTSLRLHAIRDGIEDFSLLKELENSASDNVQVKKLLENIRLYFNGRNRWFVTSRKEQRKLEDFRFKAIGLLQNVNQ